MSFPETTFVDEKSPSGNEINPAMFRIFANLKFCSTMFRRAREKKKKKEKNLFISYNNPLIRKISLKMKRKLLI